MGAAAVRAAYVGLRRMTRGQPRAQPRNPIVCGRKHCCHCGRWRHVCDFVHVHGKVRGTCRVCWARGERRKRASQTPEQHARYLEYHRIWHEGKRRRAGVVPRNWGPKSGRVVDRQLDYVWLSPEPLVRVLRGVEIRTLSRRSNVPERSIDRLLRGESRHVRIDLADKLALAVGIPLSLIYGPDAPVVYGRPSRIAA